LGAEGRWFESSRSDQFSYFLDMSARRVQRIPMSDPAITPLTPAEVAVEQSQAARENFVTRDLIALDIATSEVTGGPMDETISTRLAIDSVEGHGVSKAVGVFGSKVLDLFQKDHGADAAAGDAERAVKEQEIVKDSGIA
jgi:hypothetical protein